MASETDVKQDGQGRYGVTLSVLPLQRLRPSIGLYPIIAPMLILRRRQFLPKVATTPGLPTFIPLDNTGNETKIEVVQPTGFPFATDQNGNKLREQVLLDPLVKGEDAFVEAKKFPFYRADHVGRWNGPVNIKYFMDVVGTASYNGEMVPWIYLWVYDNTYDYTKYMFYRYESKDGGITWTLKWSSPPNEWYSLNDFLPMNYYGQNRGFKRLGNGLYFNNKTIVQKDQSTDSWPSQPEAGVVKSAAMSSPVLVGNNIVAGCGTGIQLGYCTYHRKESGINYFVNSWAMAGNLWAGIAGATRTIEYIIWTGAPAKHFQYPPTMNNPTFHTEAQAGWIWPNQYGAYPGCVYPYPSTPEEMDLDQQRPNWWYDDYHLYGMHYNRPWDIGAAHPDQWGGSKMDIHGAGYWSPDTIVTNPQTDPDKFTKVDNELQFWGTEGQHKIVDRFVPTSFWQSSGGPRTPNGSFTTVSRMSCEEWCCEGYFVTFNNFWYGPINFSQSADYLEFLVVDGELYYFPWTNGTWKTGSWPLVFYFDYGRTVNVPPPRTKHTRVRIKKPSWYVLQNWEQYKHSFSEEAHRILTRGNWPTMEEEYGPGVKQNYFDDIVMGNIMGYGTLGPAVAKMDVITQANPSSVQGYCSYSLEAQSPAEFTAFTPIVAISPGVLVVQKTVTKYGNATVYHGKSLDNGASIDSYYATSGQDAFAFDDDIVQPEGRSLAFRIVRSNAGKVYVFDPAVWPPKFTQVTGGDLGVGSWPVYDGGHGLWVIDDSILFIIKNISNPVGAKSVTTTTKDRSVINLTYHNSEYGEIESIQSVVCNNQTEVAYSYSGAYWENGEIHLAEPLPNLPSGDTWNVTINYTVSSYIRDGYKVCAVRNLMTGGVDPATAQVEVLGYLDGSFRASCGMSLNGWDLRWTSGTVKPTVIPGVGAY